MALPRKTATVLIALGYDSLEDFTATASQGVISLQWNHTDPQPTEQVINDYASDTTPLPSGQLFSEWLAENGGDPLLTLRRKAKEALDSQAAEQNALLRAVVLELLDYANADRANLNTLLTWLGGQTTLTNRGQLSAMGSVEATPAQAKDAIKARLAAGEAD